MATTAATWFYKTPENNAYLLGERVRSTFWDERFGGLWLDAVNTQSPFAMAGTHDGATVRMEWEPGKWLRVYSAPPAPAFVNGVSNVLRRKPVMRYEDPEGRTVCEWYLTPETANKRWQEIQGKPAFKNPERLDKKS
jgi:hypothetical protein